MGTPQTATASTSKRKKRTKKAAAAEADTDNVVDMPPRQETIPGTLKEYDEEFSEATLERYFAQQYLEKAKKRLKAANAELNKLHDTHKVRVYQDPHFGLQSTQSIKKSWEIIVEKAGPSEADIPKDDF